MSQVYEADLVVDADRGNTGVAMKTSHRLFSPLVAFCLAAAWLGCQGNPESTGNTDLRDSLWNGEASPVHEVPRAALVQRAAVEEQTPAEPHDKTLESGPEAPTKAAAKQAFIESPDRSLVKRNYLSGYNPGYDYNARLKISPASSKAFSSASSSAFYSPTGSSSVARPTSHAAMPPLNEEQSLIVREQVATHLEEILIELQNLRQHASTVFKNLQSEMSTGPQKNDYEDAVEESESNYEAAQFELAEFLERGPKLVRVLLNEPGHMLTIPEIIRSSVPRQEIAASTSRLKNSINELVTLANSWLLSNKGYIQPGHGYPRMDELLQNSMPNVELTGLEILDNVSRREDDGNDASERSITGTDLVHDGILYKVQKFNNLLSFLRTVPRFVNEVCISTKQAIANVADAKIQMLHGSTLVDGAVIPRPIRPRVLVSSNLPSSPSDVPSASSPASHGSTNVVIMPIVPCASSDSSSASSSSPSLPSATLESSASSTLNVLTDVPHASTGSSSSQVVDSLAHSHSSYDSSSSSNSHHETRERVKDLIITPHFSIGQRLPHSEDSPTDHSKLSNGLFKPRLIGHYHVEIPSFAVGDPPSGSHVSSGNIISTPLFTIQRRPSHSSDDSAERPDSSPEVHRHQADHHSKQHHEHGRFPSGVIPLEPNHYAPGDDFTDDSKAPTFADTLTSADRLMRLRFIEYLRRQYAKHGLQPFIMSAVGSEGSAPSDSSPTDDFESPTSADSDAASASLDRLMRLRVLAYIAKPYAKIGRQPIIMSSDGSEDSTPDGYPGLYNGYDESTYDNFKEAVFPDDGDSTIKSPGHSGLITNIVSHLRNHHDHLKNHFDKTPTEPESSRPGGHSSSVDSGIYESYDINLDENQYSNDDDSMASSSPKSPGHSGLIPHVVSHLRNHHDHLKNHFDKTPTEPESSRPGGHSSSVDSEIYESHDVNLDEDQYSNNDDSMASSSPKSPGHSGLIPHIVSHLRNHHDHLKNHFDKTPTEPENSRPGGHSSSVDSGIYESYDVNLYEDQYSNDDDSMASSAPKSPGHSGLIPHIVSHLRNHHDHLKNHFDKTPTEPENSRPGGHSSSVDSGIYGSYDVNLYDDQYSNNDDSMASSSPKSPGHSGLIPQIVPHLRTYHQNFRDHFGMSETGSESVRPGGYSSPHHSGRYDGYDVILNEEHYPRIPYGMRPNAGSIPPPLLKLSSYGKVIPLAFPRESVLQALRTDSLSPGDTVVVKLQNAAFLVGSVYDRVSPIFFRLVSSTEPFSQFATRLDGRTWNIGSQDFRDPHCRQVFETLCR